jgi:hypothetical protein
MMKTYLTLSLLFTLTATDSLSAQSVAAAATASVSLPTDIATVEELVIAYMALKKQTQAASQAMASYSPRLSAKGTLCPGANAYALPLIVSP